MIQGGYVVWLLFRWFMVWGLLLWTPAPRLAPGLGVGINPKAQFGGSVLAVELLNPPYWHNWGQPNSEQFVTDPRFMPLMKRCCFLSDAEITQLAAAYPGRIWLLLNEPENPDQDNWTPQDAVAKIKQWRAAIGDNGIFACCGTIVWQPALDWLDEYLRLGGLMPVVWHIHIYGARTGPEWDAILEQWWAWCTSRDVCRPIIVSETGPGWATGSPEPLLRYLLAYDDPRVWGTMWFSSVDDEWGRSSLMDAGGLTALGQIYSTGAQ